LSGLTGDLAGKYYPLGKMTKAEEAQMIADHFLFQKPTGHLMVNSGAVRDWPDARGIWHNVEKTFLIWLNEEDQCRIISMQQGGDVQATFERFGRGITEIANLMKKNGNDWAWNERLGYICTCPSNLGTGMRASVHVQLRRLSKDPRFEDIVLALELQKRGTGGEHTEAVDDIYDMSNRARLKKSEREFVQLLINGVQKLIDMEKRLAAGKPIDDLIPKKA
jgi:creatine kinase